MVRSMNPPILDLNIALTLSFLTMRMRMPMAKNSPDLLSTPKLPFRALLVLPPRL